jgi:pimeloyl-ACP methyl ester carboxylesterase
MQPRYILGRVPGISENTVEIGGLPVFWRSAPAPDPAAPPATGAAAVVDSPGVPASTAPSPAAERPAPILYLHGVPTSSEDWLPFLERGGGIAPDLPGFGRSGKPGYLKYTIDEYADFIERFLDVLGIERVRMVVHDWGAVGLAFAQRAPERVERLVVMNAVTFLPGYRWHRTARIWRTPVLGELAMGATTRRALRIATREANVTPGPLPDAWIDSVLAHLDQGTQRAILRLYRSSPSEVLAKAGARLHDLTMPALVVWGMRDPYIPARFAHEYARALHAELLELADAGHWWWLDRPDAIERVLAFLLAP